MATLFVSDLDGTLLTGDGTLSAASRDGLDTLLARGLPFTVASARSVVSMRSVLGPLDLSLPVVAFNGGFISDWATGRHRHVLSIDADTALALFALARGTGLSMMVSTHTPAGDRMYVPTSHNQGIGLYVADRVRHADPRLRVVPDPAVGLAETVTCLTVIARAAEVDAYVAALPPSAHALQLHVSDDRYTPGWRWLTVHATGASKGRAVRRVMAEARLEGHRLVVFGDELNDLDLFREADHAVAVANALPELREAADEVIGPHHEDSVVRWLLAHA